MSMGSIGHQFSEVAAHVKHVIGLAPGSRAAGTFTGPVVDRSKYGNVAVVVCTGQASGSPTALNVTVKLQDSNDSGGSGMTDFSGTVSVTGVNGIAVLSVPLVGAKQFVRVHCSVSFTGGTSPEVQLAVLLAFGDADKVPV